LTEIQDVTGTAFIVAEYRAEENAEAHPLYRDPIVSLFLDERTRAAAERMAAGFPPARQGVKLRTRYYDDHLDAQLGNGCRQVVILGAGLDTRGVRKQAPGVTYFEIDDADTIGFKQARLAEPGSRPRSCSSPATTSLTACCGCLTPTASTSACRPTSFGKATPCT
jgi:methyltransferase (TIGR00027 family)